MPLASPGAFTFLLAQAPALCGTPPLSASVSPPDAEIVQRDETFVIVSDTEPGLDKVPESSPIGPDSLKIGSTVQIDPNLLVAGTPTTGGTPR